MTNKDFIKQGLTIDNIEYFLTYMQAEPIRKNDIIVSKTICHNPIGEGSHKLYYYANTSLFKCFTDCEGDAFDIFELVIKIFKLQGKELSLPQSIIYIANFFNIPINNIETNDNQRFYINDDFDGSSTSKDFKLCIIGDTIECDIYKNNYTDENFKILNQK